MNFTGKEKRPLIACTTINGPPITQGYLLYKYYSTTL